MRALLRGALGGRQSVLRLRLSFSFRRSAASVRSLGAGGHWHCDDRGSGKHVEFQMHEVPPLVGWSRNGPAAFRDAAGAVSRSRAAVARGCLEHVTAEIGVAGDAAE